MQVSAHPEFAGPTRWVSQPLFPHNVTALGHTVQLVSKLVPPTTSFHIIMVRGYTRKKRRAPAGDADVFFLSGSMAALLRLGFLPPRCPVFL